MRDLRRELKERKVQMIGGKIPPHMLVAKADRGGRPPRGKRCKMEEKWRCFRSRSIRSTF